MIGWMLTWIDPSLQGGLPEKEALEVSWDAQSDIEEAMRLGEELTVMLMDYWKFSDAMELIFIRDFMCATGFDPQYCNMMLDMHTNLQRYVKLGKSMGQPFGGHNGFGQGDT